VLVVLAAAIAGCGDGDDRSPKQGKDAPHAERAQAAGSPVGEGSKPHVGANGASIVPGSAFVGTWEGLATQNGPGKHETSTYPVSMRIDPKVEIDESARGEDAVTNGTIRYPSFDCGGRVTIFEAGKGREGVTNGFGEAFRAPAQDVGYRYGLEERIVEGRDDCGAGGTITAVTEGDELDWRWKDGDLEATAILQLRDAPERAPASEEEIRELQGHEYSGTVTQWGPRGGKASYELYYVLYPPDGPSFGPGDGHTQSFDGPCMGNGVLRIESVSGDRAVLRRRFDRYSNCIGGGVIQTRLVDGKLLFRWLRQGDDDRGEQDDVIALGTLTKAGPARGPAPG
jgi:hypothetical protein